MITLLGQNEVNGTQRDQRSHRNGDIQLPWNTAPPSPDQHPHFDTHLAWAALQKSLRLEDQMAEVLVSP